MDFFMAWLADHPGSHIYHYAAYEEQALKTLSMWHGTREQEVDHLLRSGALVDLFRVVRQGIRISKHSYSLKQVESFYWREREAKVKEAGGSIVAYERWLQSRDQEALHEIELYNTEDVHSTRGLRDWLLVLRQELIETGAEVTWRPPPEESESSEKREAADAETAALRERLRADRRRGRRPAGRAAALPPPRGQAELVVVLRAPQDVDGRPARRRRGDRRPRAGRRRGHDRPLPSGTDAASRCSSSSWGRARCLTRSAGAASRSSRWTRSRARSS